MKTTIKAAGAIILSGLLLTGCSGQTKASQAKPSVEPQLALLTKQVKSLYADSKYEMPAKDLSKVGLTKADNQRAKVYKLRGELSKAQQKTFKVNQQQLTAAKRILSVQDTLNVQLGKDQVLKNENLKVQDLNTDFTYLKKNKAMFAKTIQGKIELLNNEVKAVSLIKAAVSGDPDQAKIDQARDAINAVNVKAFKEKYLPQLDEAIKKLPKDQQTEQAKKQAAAGDPEQASIAQAAASSSSSVTAAVVREQPKRQRPITQQAPVLARKIQPVAVVTAVLPTTAAVQYSQVAAKCSAFNLSVKKQPAHRWVVRLRVP